MTASPAPAMLTKEQLDDIAEGILRDSKDNPGAVKRALLLHIAALEQRVEVADARIAAADKLASVAIHNHATDYCGKGKCGICTAIAAYRALPKEPR